MKKAKPLEVALMAVLSLAAAYLLNRFWAVLEGLPAGNPIERLLDTVDAIISGFPCLLPEALSLPD